ncbi:AAA family ATPase [Acidipropionibacterium timonense]|uniref:AAA family ATPase n=1 Tax=Acidipropionibacterium timonense TaxID=2161818 RepID=UPI001FD90065|nr:AAA family ATPase [Acidipropionibacterium timonense]
MGPVPAGLSEVVRSLLVVITMVAVKGYRSIHDLVLPLGRVTVVTGANGVGKSNLYRSLRLLAGVAHGRLVPSLAAEGGLSQVLWAGPEHVSAAMRRGEVSIEGTAARSAPVMLGLGMATEDLGYLVDVGLPQASAHETLFFRDPEIKREAVFVPPLLRGATTLVDRRWSKVRVRDATGTWDELDLSLGPRSSVIEEFSDHRTTPELVRLRHVMASWRFHEGIRTDPGAPARRPCVATRTVVLAGDGSDLAAAIGTVLESSWADPFRAAVEEALGVRIDVVGSDDGTVRLALRQTGLLRPLDATEVSDGTLRLLVLAAALCSPAPASLLVLNEPETSLHPSVLPALAGLIRQAARRTQILVVSHDDALVRALGEPDGDGLVHHELVRDLGRTELAGVGLLDRPRWNWGTRRRW